ncbi:ATP-binding protein [Devosia chinhatensis]|uniref:ATP-binding protein n=1 Tax=Devosia chinhatensis TaxID=429727 RepID=UPI000695EDE1|nr:ATP-binding protein [Devosia chinhatensis]
MRNWASSWRTLIAALVASAVFLVMAGAFAVREQSVYHDFALNRLQQQASALTTSTATLLTEVDQSLLYVADNVTDAIGTPQFRARLSEALRIARATTQLPNSVFALDARGRVFALATDVYPEPFPLGDVDYALAHIEGKVEGVFVGAARLGRLGTSSGRWIFGLSRAVRAADGTLIAILVATIPIDRLSPLLVSSYGAEPGVGTWIALDGRLLLREPFIPDAILDQPEDQRQLYERLLASQASGTTELISYADGQRRAIAWQRSEAFPIATAVAVATSPLMNEWQRTFRLGLFGAILFCTAMVLGGYFIDRLRLISATERRLAMDRFEHLLGGIKDIFIAVDRDLNITEYNAAAAEKLGSGDVIGRPLFELFPELREERNRNALAEATLSRQRVQVQIEQPQSGDTYLLHFYPFLDGVAILAERVTERMVMEARLNQSQKMEALGQLTGGIAHDFNNLLTVIVGNAEALLDLDMDEESKRNAEGIVHGAEQAAELTRQLLAFARQQPLTPRSLDLNRHISAMQAMLRRVLPETISITLNLDEVWSVWVDATQLDSALLNIVINARDAMPDGGSIVMETAGIQIDQRDSMPGVDLKMGQYVRISITDSGTGMPPDIAARAFDPFFSTKPEGSGTGLGLSMVYGFARQSGGQVSLYSEPGHGTTISLYLPRSLQSFSASDMAQEISAKEPLEGGTETILIVEDNALVRVFARNTLRQLGYRVVEAEDAATALALFAKGETFDLVLSDIVLPGDMSGPALVETLWQRQHRFALLFMSGYPKSALKTAAPLGDIEVLGKPFKRDALARAVRSALQRGPAG